MTIYRTTVVIRNPILGGNGTNTWHVRNDDAAPDLLANLEAASVILQLAYVDLLTLMPATTIVESNGEWLAVEEEEPTLEQTDAWEETGGSGDPLPPSQCIVIGWRTALASKRGRGRTFVGPIAESWNDVDGTPSDTALTVARDVADAIIAWNVGAGSPGAAFGVYSPSDGVIRDFTARTVHDKFAYLGSRRD